MFEILTLNKIAKCGTEKFGGEYNCSENASAPDAIMVRSAAMHEMDFADNTLAIARAGAGVNNIPIEKCTQSGIAVFNTPGANANAVKELILCALLMTSRKIPAAMEWCAGLKGEGDAVGKLVEKGKSAFAGPEIMGKTLGVVGLGAIGALVANDAAKLGMNVVGYDPFLSVRGALALSPEIKVVEKLDELFAVCDYLTLHVPLNDSTRSTVSAASIAKMKDGVRILNFARGELVDSQDIVEAVNSGKVAAYATDFPTDAQLQTPGIIAIPHLGASTPESEDNCAVMAALELKAYLEKGETVNSVNLPPVVLPAVKNARICVIGSQEAVGEATAVLSKINTTMLTSVAGRGVSYLAADIDDTAAAESAAGELRLLPGVIRVRVIK